VSVSVPIVLLNAGTIDNSTLMLLVGVVVLIVMLTISTRRRVTERSHSPQQYLREQLSRVREQQGVRDDIEALLLQLEALSREISAQVDVRFAKLERAIADADARLAELRRLGLGPPSTPSDTPSRSSEPVGAEEVPSQGSAPSPGPETAPPIAAVPPPVVPPGPSDAVDELKRRVLEMADAGLAPIEIARRLDKNVGEVELIIKLNRPGNPRT